MNSFSKRFFTGAVVAAGFFAALPLRGAEVLRAEAGNVGPATFSLLYELSEGAEVDLRFFDAPEGGSEITEPLRVEWYPLDTGSPAIPGSTYGDRVLRYDLREQIQDRSLVLVRVGMASPATTYHAELLVRRHEEEEWTPAPRVAVTTSARTSFVAESRQIVIDLTAAGLDLGGTVARIRHASAPYPLFTVVGDIPGAGRAYADLSHFLRADGTENAVFSGGETFDLDLWGFPAGEVAAEIVFTDTFTVASATTVPFAIGEPPEVAAFVFDAVGNQFVGVPFTITVRAVDDAGNTVTAFSESVLLSASTPALTGGGPTPPFVGGRLQGHEVALDEAGEHTLSVYWEEGDVSGVSDPFLVQALPGPWELVLTVDPAGAGVATGGGTFAHNTSAPISIGVESGWRFVHWLGEGVADPYDTESSVLMTEDRFVTAVLMPLDPEETYNAWKQRYFLRLAADPVLTAPDYDANNSGLSNLLEYAFGNHPLSNDDTRRGPEVHRDARGLFMTFHRRVNNAGLHVLIESAATTEGPWSEHVPDPADLVVTPLGDGIEHVEATLPEPAEGRAFYRLRVHLNE